MQNFAVTSFKLMTYCNSSKNFNDIININKYRAIFSMKIFNLIPVADLIKLFFLFFQFLLLSLSALLHIEKIIDNNLT